MTRIHRIDPGDCWHHVTNHVAGDGELFYDDDERHLFMRLLVWASVRVSVDVSGFSLMGNHFHLLLYCANGGLSDFMQLVQSVYGRSFRIRRQNRGPVYVDRFHNTVITSDEQLLTTARYIDRNALELGIDIETYPWASYPTHVSGSGLHSPKLDAACAIPVRLCGGPAAYEEFVRTDGPSDKFSLSDGRRQVQATPYRSVKDILSEFVAVASVVTGTPSQEIIAPSPGARAGARLATLLAAHRHVAAFRFELQEFFGYRAESSLASAVARAEKKYASHVEFRAMVDVIATAWDDALLDRAA